MGPASSWEPRARLVLAWRLKAEWRFDPAFEMELELRFKPDREDFAGVDLEHDLERFGARAEAIRASIGSAEGWPGLLDGYAGALKAGAPNVILRGGGEHPDRRVVDLADHADAGEADAGLQPALPGEGGRDGKIRRHDVQSELPWQADRPGKFNACSAGTDVAHNAFDEGLVAQQDLAFLEHLLAPFAASVVRHGNPRLRANCLPAR
jgi:hypothetical protein